ncbi:MAG TPA: putative Ig domain-containing protein [Bryobacteraceae bacterium]|nr:putative Ig domain-containing protein [Bryobacteraceae bacterium]
MGRFFGVLCLIACASGSVLEAQITPQSYEATVGVPFSFDYAAALGLTQIPAILPAGFTFTYSFTADSGSLPPGLTISSAGLISGTPTTAGNYQYTLNFNFTIAYMGYSQSASIPVPGFLVVTGNTGPPVQAVPGALSFSLTKGSAPTGSQSIVITNNGSTPQTFSASASTESGGDWLTLTPASGTVAPFSSTSVSITASAANLNVGTFLGSVAVTTSPASQAIPPIAVIATVSGGEPELRISQSGLFFATVQGGGAPPSQSISVLNSGSGNLNFTVATSTTAGGKWLSASPASGAASASNAGNVTVSIDPTGLQANTYYGQVTIAASGVSNSPQTISIVLKVADAGFDLGASVYPTGLIFVAPAGGADPAAKTVSLTNPSTTAISFAAVPLFGQDPTSLSATPASGTVNSTTPVQISVQPKITGLAVGVYLGEVGIQFSDAKTRHVAVLLIITPAGSTTALDGTMQPHASGSCVPKKLIPVFTQLGVGFSTVAAWPTPIEATVVDDCGNLLTAGSVVASFSNGDPALQLNSLNDGRWSATWQPNNSAATVTVTVQAEESAPPLQGTQSIGGTLQSNPVTPAIQGIVSPADYAKNRPLAPGSFTAIFGAHLSSGQNPALSLPLSTQLGATQVTLGGRLLPLNYAADGQVNAIIPYDVPTNSTQQLIVTNGPALSVPQTITIAPAQPAVFTLGDGSGVVFDVKPGKTDQVLVDAGHPMSAGDAIVIYCAGLGAVSPPVAAGAAAPSSPPAITTNKTTVTIGGKSAQVFFSGMVGGFAGLYQVNAYVPKGITAGNTVPLVVTVAGFDSTPVTVAVK